MTDESDLIKAILFNPGDDTPRLIYADWLDDHGQAERAEFIRVQIDISNAVGPARKPQGKSDSLFQKYKKQWFGDVHAKIESIYISRGFPSSVTLPLRTFVGGECPLCRGDGHHRIQFPDGSWQRNEIGGTCGHFEDSGGCGGSGRVPGIAKELFKKWPITEVHFSDEFDAPSGPGNPLSVNYGRRLAGLPPLTPSSSPAPPPQ